MRLKAPPPVACGVCLFQACGVVGSIVACALALRAASARDLPFPFLAVLVALTIITQASVALLAKVSHGGREILVFHRHAAVLLLTVAGAAMIAAQPVRAWLDVVTPALFAFQSVGRLGCWAAGCCYGRPSRFGFTYGEAHGDALARELRGVPLWPAQLAESAVAAGSAVAGVAGAPFYTCLAMYAAARFLLEYLRGEPGRVRALGLTEAQWVAAAVVSVIWPLSIPLLAAIVIFCRPLSPEHVLQLIRAIACTRMEKAVATTSFGLVLKREAGELHMLSSVTAAMSRRVRILDRLVCAIRST